MSASILTKKFELPKVNWWLWLCISLPVGIWLLCLPHDRGAWEVSDWGYLTDWIRHYRLTREFWRHAFTALVTSFGVSFTGGLIVQYCITAIWQRFKDRRS